RVGPGAPAEVADAVQQVAVGHAGRREDQLLAGREVLGRVDAALVAVAPRLAASVLLGRAVAEPRLDLAAQALQRGRGQDAFRRATDAHDRVDAGARDGAADRRRQVAVGDELDPGA